MNAKILSRAIKLGGAALGLIAGGLLAGCFKVDDAEPESPAENDCVIDDVPFEEVGTTEEVKED